MQIEKERKRERQSERDKESCQKEYERKTYKERYSQKTVRYIQIERDKSQRFKELEIALSKIAKKMIKSHNKTH